MPQADDQVCQSPSALRTTSWRPRNQRSCRGSQAAGPMSRRRRYRGYGSVSASSLNRSMSLRCLTGMSMGVSVVM